MVNENPYGDTNHGHLGQLLTSAAGAAAQGGRVLAVWLTEHVWPAHLAALEFLNRISSGEESAFGMVLVRVRFTPSRESFYVYFEVEAQPFINSTPHGGGKSQQVITAKGDFIDAVVAKLDPALLGAGLQRQGQFNRKHGAVAYRLPKSIELSGFGSLRVVCTASYTDVAIYLGRQSTPQGNWVVAELLRTTYEGLVVACGLRMDAWHGSGASTKRDRVITRLEHGYGDGSPESVADEAATILTGWVRLLHDHPLTGSPSRSPTSTTTEGRLAQSCEVSFAPLVSRSSRVYR